MGEGASGEGEEDSAFFLWWTTRSETLLLPGGLKRPQKGIKYQSGIEDSTSAWHDAGAVLPLWEEALAFLHFSVILKWNFSLVLFCFMIPLCSLCSIFPNHLANNSFFNNSNNVYTLIISTILCLELSHCRSAKVTNLMVMAQNSQQSSTRFTFFWSICSLNLLHHHKFAQKYISSFKDTKFFFPNCSWRSAV